MANIALNNLALITQEDTHNIIKNKDPKKDSQCENKIHPRVCQEYTWKPSAQHVNDAQCSF